MPNSEWIMSGAQAVVKIVADPNSGEVMIEGYHQWIHETAFRPPPSPTDAAVTAARNRVVEAADHLEIEMQDRIVSVLGDRLMSAVREWRALTAPPKPPLEVALEELRKYDKIMIDAWGSSTPPEYLVFAWNRIRAAIPLLEAAIKGDG